MPDDNQITIFAKTNFRNKEVPFGIKTDDRRRHMYIIGKTGMGKTTLMENMVIQDIKNGHGVAFLDPHGDSVQRILDSVPSNRVNDVIYFNPADLEYPVAFNILEAVDIKYKHLVASGLMGVFTKIWANLWSARMEYILNNTILALLDSPGNTLLGITRMYVDKKYRKKIVDNVKDPMVRAFWVDEFANYNEKYRTEAIAPIQNKVGQFLSSGIIRNIVGQPKSTLDLREIMDKQKILIMDLSKGKVGEDNSALLGAMIVTKLQLAAMSRTDIPELERKDFYLYVDEFQNFATDSFATILSEARKYRLNLVVGHQYIGQLVQERNTKVRDAIFGNVGTLVVFRVGAEDAEFLVKEFEPVFTEIDIVNLPKYQVILKLMINGVASDPFSATTLSPNPNYVTNNGEKVIKVSRERYSNAVLEVEEKITRWMGSDDVKDKVILLGDDSDEKKDAEDSSPEPAEAQAQEAVPVPAPEHKLEMPLPEPEKSNSVIASEPEVPMPTPAPVIAQEPKQEPKAPAPVAAQQQNQQPRQSNAPQHQNHTQPHHGHGQRPNHNQHQHPHKNSSRPDNRQHQKPMNRKPQQPQKKQNPIWDTVANIHAEKLKASVPVVKEQQVSPTVPEPKLEAPKPHSVVPMSTKTSDRHVIQPGQAHTF